MSAFSLVRSWFGRFTHLQDGWRAACRCPSNRRLHCRPAVEMLEPRLVPSALAGSLLPDATVQVRIVPSQATVLPASGTGQPAGFSPSQIRHAYGFDQITFNNGTVQGDGTGQTIAIIDAYDDPNIASNLATFDAMYSLPAPPSFTKVNETGGTSYPTADQSWALEISLDVEWAHAIAPGANILLVEASTSGLGDLITAVDYARHQTGVATVSMSWGSDEFSAESLYDSYLTTPSGHSGITFVASSGDSGSSGAPEYVSVSPNVLAVGATALTTDSLGTYQSETGWSGSGGGISLYESQPGYQKGVVTQTSTMRAVPDVAYDGASTSPYAVYDSYNATGWIQVYGTSAGAPQWAALVAIADQGLALAGKGSLDGPAQTLPQLYQLPSSDFHDITTGSNGAYSAGPGYDLVTGLGSPQANLIVAALVGSGSTSGTPPTVVTPASATPNPVTGTTTTLSVQGTDASGAASLSYTWSVSSAPAGAATPTFRVNGTNAAQNTTATFYAAGTYTFQVTLTDPARLTATSSVSVTVYQTLTSVAVSPGSVSLADGSSQQFTATAKDQFGEAMTTQPAWTWTLASGSGTLNGSGLYTTPSTGSGTASVQASGGGLTSSATVTYGSTPLAPSSLTATAPSGTQVNLSWVNNASNASGFIIQRSTNGTSWTQLATISATTTSYSDKTVNKRKTYYYRVYAYNSLGNSSYSNVATVVTPNVGITGALSSPADAPADLFWMILARKTAPDDLWAGLSLVEALTKRRQDL